MSLNKLKIALLIIDPNYDFHDVPDHAKISFYDENKKERVNLEPGLPVPGSWEDALRVGNLIENYGHLIDQIFITKDNHPLYHIAHPYYWLDKNNEHPAPFTQITLKDIQEGLYKPVDGNKQEHVIFYASELKRKNRAPLMIWNPHSMDSAIGQSIVQPIQSKASQWSLQAAKPVVTFSKGENPDTENYGVFEAEVPLDDPRTQLRKTELDELKKYDAVLVCGQAKSHCWSTSIEQMTNYYSRSEYSKIHMLVDATSNVTGFESIGDGFVDRMEKAGLIKTTTTNVFDLLATQTK